MPHAQARKRQGRRHCGGAGKTGHGNIALGRRGHQGQARIRNNRHAGIGNDEDGARRGGIDKLLGPVLFIVIKIGHHPSRNLDPQGLGQIAHAPRIFGRDDVRILQGMH